jgi:hypothetical protein
MVRGWPSVPAALATERERNVMATNNYGKDELVKRVTAMIEGLDRYAASMTPIAAMGQTYAPAAMRAKLQAIVDLRQNVSSMKGQLQQALAAEAAQMPELLALASAYRAHVKVAYSTSPEALGAHGIIPRVRVPWTTEAQLAAVAKRAATRKARRTMGPRQKEKIKGDVVGVAITPLHAGASPPDGET